MKPTNYLIVCLLLAGCQNGFEEFYRNAAPISPNITLAPFSGSPQLESTSDIAGDGKKLREQGYVALGIASFETGRNVSLDQIKAKAMEVGADIVLWSDQYLGTQQSALVLPDLQTATTNGSVGGLPYSSTTSVMGSQVVPIAIRRYSWIATFWRKAQSYVFGVTYNNLEDNLKQQLQRNTGVYVNYAVAGSPAYRANILPGDIIIKFGDHDVESAAQFSQLISLERGKPEVVTLIRNLQTISIPVQLNP